MQYELLGNSGGIFWRQAPNAYTVPAGGFTSQCAYGVPGSVCIAVLHIAFGLHMLYADPELKYL